MNAIHNGLTCDDIQDLADMVYHQLSEANRQADKYANIVKDYLLVQDYHKNATVTLEQAQNSVKLWNGKVEHYDSLFQKLKTAGAQ